MGERNLTQARRETARLQASAVAFSIGVGLELGDYEAVEAALNSVRLDPDVSFVVLSGTDGAVLARYAKTPGAGAGDQSETMIRASAPIHFRGAGGSVEPGLSTARLKGSEGLGGVAPHRHQRHSRFLQARSGEVRDPKPLQVRDVSAALNRWVSAEVTAP
jgi:hypothetical protein